MLSLFLLFIWRYLILFNFLMNINHIIFLTWLLLGTSFFWASIWISSYGLLLLFPIFLLLFLSKQSINLILHLSFISFFHHLLISRFLNVWMIDCFIVPLCLSGFTIIMYFWQLLISRWLIPRWLLLFKSFTSKIINFNQIS